MAEGVHGNTEEPPSQVGVVSSIFLGEMTSQLKPKRFSQTRGRAEMGGLGKV